MGAGSSIEWTDDTWNPTVGCSRVSEGCDFCYAERDAPRHRNLPAYQGVSIGSKWSGKVNEVADRLDWPLRRTAPRRIFVNSMSDLFHESISLAFQVEVFAVMAAAGWHTFQVLTKRPQVMARVLNNPLFQSGVIVAHSQLVANPPRNAADRVARAVGWPLPNVHLGVSIESPKYAYRARHLQATPAAVRFVSAEPLLGAVSLAQYLVPLSTPGCGTNPPEEPPPGLDWVIVGGESGPKARPMHPDWARQLRDECAAAGVPFLFKQWGNWRPLAGDECAKAGDRWAGGTQEVMMRNVGKHQAGRVLDGRTHDGFPTGMVRA